MHQLKKKLIAVIIIILIILPIRAEAQQTIIIVPSPDVLNKGQIYPRITYQLRPFHPDPIEMVSPSMVYGLSNTEEIYTIISASNLENSVLKPNMSLAYKKIFPFTENTRLTIGNRMTINLKESTTPVNFLYYHLSQKIPFTGTRLTAGLYNQSADHFFPTRTGALLGFEQYIIPNKLQLDVDWISRNETFGYMGAGFKYKLRPDIVIVTAVLIPNGNKAKFSFLFFIGKIFK